ncbi:MAG: hypothetical protein JNL90_11320 [Planctomycetes bacterium]|nr:hypothetical protein [Planctomycetota bacterium]
MIARSSSLLRACVGALAWRLAGATALAQYQLPPALARPPELFDDQVVLSARDSELARCVLRWSQGPNAQVTVIRKERESTAATAAWSVQEQLLPVGFVPTAVEPRVAGGQLTELYLAGMRTDGSAIVECWSFEYGATPTGAPYVALAQRPLPIVQRATRLASTAYGTIRALGVDPEDRFLLFLSYEKPALWKLALPGDGVTKLHDATSLPALAHKGSIRFRTHVTEGRQVHLTNRQPYQRPDPSLPDPLVVLRDRDDDGTFDSVWVPTDAEWSAGKYDRAESWTLR